jgi:hypothetical protein
MRYEGSRPICDLPDEVRVPPNVVGNRPADEMRTEGQCECRRVRSTARLGHAELVKVGAYTSGSDRGLNIDASSRPVHTNASARGQIHERTNRDRLVSRIAGSSRFRGRSEEAERDRQPDTRSMCGRK